MEKKQGFFSALREEVVRGLSPARSRSRSESPRRARRRGRTCCTGWGGGGSSRGGFRRGYSCRRLGSWRRWLRGRRGGAAWGRRVGAVDEGAALPGAVRVRRCRLLPPLGPPPPPRRHGGAAGPRPRFPDIRAPPPQHQGHSHSQYILQQYTAASGGLKLLSSIRNAYAMGKVRMVASEFETATRVIKNHSATKDAEPGGFVLWQMAPGMWYVELAVGGSKVRAGCNGKLVWRHTPWLGANAAKGPVRPLRRALQGLDPLTTASMFSDAQCIGEKKVNGEDCFILKLCADPQTLKARSEGPAEIIRHPKDGASYMEDSHLTRIQSGVGGDAVYWETSINSSIDDYRPVEGVMIAHSGRSVVNLFRFGEVASHQNQDGGGVDHRGSGF
ncbi:hypothetical protein MUK42_15120 [Musa troglodytarum]|uniref:Uncharacterized protein n=1 Tax=Musa troglodytarum TaxID=320322 RepID=A0A9E7I4Y5_9LILI|nr:hypothetical protein MUK42_15120 [Musa troglodytarum]